MQAPCLWGGGGHLHHHSCTTELNCMAATQAHADVKELYPYQPQSVLDHNLVVRPDLRGMSVAEPASAAQDLQFFGDCEGQCHRKDRLEVRVLSTAQCSVA